MVDIRLEAVGLNADDSGTKDTYVAIRVGESQKLCRLSRRREFKFPQNVVGDRKFGRVDVFKRIGSASISVQKDPAAEFEEINMPFVQGDSMKFNVFVSGSAAREKPASQEVSSAISEANTYLKEHNLEMRLSEAMQAVLRERPADPTKFIAEKMKESEGIHRKILSGPGTAQEPAKARLEETKESAPELTGAAVGNRSTTNQETPQTPVKSSLEDVKQSAPIPPGAAVDDGSATHKETTQKPANSSLDDAKQSAPISDLKSNKNKVEELRAGLKKSISKAVDNGQLEKALRAQFPDGNMDPQCEASREAQADSSRAKIEAVLSETAENGLLENALKEQLSGAEEDSKKAALLS